MERYKEFDAAKGIASYLVVLGHLLTQIGNRKIIIIAFCHMPLFFFVSGYLMYFSFHKYGIASFVRKKFFSLFVPYWIWSSISFLANILMGIRGKQEVWQEFVSIFFEARSVWFLIVLFISLTLFALCLYIANAIKANCYIVCGAVWIFLVMSVGNDMFSFFEFKRLFPFMILGYLLAERKTSIILSSTKQYIFFKGMIVSFPIIALCTYSEQYFTNYIFFNYTNLIEILMGIGYYLVSMWGICFIMLMAKCICSHAWGNILLEIGRYSMHIYVMHMFMIKFVFFVPNIIKEHRWLFLWIYMPVYAAIIMILIVIVSKKILDKSKLFRIMIGKQ